MNMGSLINMLFYLLYLRSKLHAEKSITMQYITKTIYDCHINYDDKKYER